MRVLRFAHIRWRSAGRARACPPSRDPDERRNCHCLTRTDSADRTGGANGWRLGPYDLFVLVKRPREARRGPPEVVHQKRVLRENSGNPGHSSDGQASSSPAELVHAHRGRKQSTAEYAEVRRGSMRQPNGKRRPPRTRRTPRPRRTAARSEMSSRAAARDLLYESRGRASYRFVRADPSLPLGMTNELRSGGTDRGDADRRCPWRPSRPSRP